MRSFEKKSYVHDIYFLPFSSNKYLIFIGALTLGCWDFNMNMCSGDNCPPSSSRAAMTVDEIEHMSFQVCDTDSDGSLSWKEVETCEVC